MSSHAGVRQSGLGWPSCACHACGPCGAPSRFVTVRQSSLVKSDVAMPRCGLSGEGPSSQVALRYGAARQSSCFVAWRGKARAVLVRQGKSRSGSRVRSRRASAPVAVPVRSWRAQAVLARCGKSIHVLASQVLAGSGSHVGSSPAGKVGKVRFWVRCGSRVNSRPAAVWSVVFFSWQSSPAGQRGQWPVKAGHGSRGAASSPWSGSCALACHVPSRQSSRGKLSLERRVDSVLSCAVQAVKSGRASVLFRRQVWNRRGSRGAARRALFRRALAVEAINGERGLKCFGRSV